MSALVITSPLSERLVMPTTKPLTALQMTQTAPTPAPRTEFALLRLMLPFATQEAQLASSLALLWELSLLLPSVSLSIAAAARATTIITRGSEKKVKYSMGK